MENITPYTELLSRWSRFTALLQQYIPQAEGAFIFSRLNIYYFTGTFASGVLWLPVEGEPFLLCRRGIERARIESSVPTIAEFTSYGDMPGAFAELGVRFPKHAGAEMGGLSWALSVSLTKHLPDVQFVPVDRLIDMVRAKKSAWELQILRETGKKHDRCMMDILPKHLRAGMSELEISYKLLEIFNAEGHQCVQRMNAFGEEVFLGHIAVGDNANYPSVFNGPVGLRGVHPAIPFMGSAAVRWEAGMPLTIDSGFSLAGYQTDKTQVYWLGDTENIPDLVRKAQDFCVAMQEELREQLRPGTLPSALWQQCVDKALQRGWSEGFMGLGKNKVGFVGHGIGLAIDEYPVLAKGFDLPLEEGMVLAIEPKIGLPGVGMVGAENTFAVTDNGGKSLTGGSYDILCI